VATISGNTLIIKRLDKVKTVNDNIIIYYGKRPSVGYIYIVTDWFTYVELKCSRMYSRSLEYCYILYNFKTADGASASPEGYINFFL
jgi:hypothetical protein